jgi:uncharacterized protein (DUF58 family)
MRLNLARLNHILLPSTKAGRDRARRSLLVRSLGPAIWVYTALSEEGRVALLLSALIGALGLEVQTTQIYVLWSVLASLLLSSLAARRAFALGPKVRLEVSLPRRVAVGDEVRFSLAVINDGARGYDRVRLRGPMLPWDGAYAGGRPPDRSLPAGSTARFSVIARFSERGEHHLDPFRAHALAPLGLAQGKGVEGQGSRALVVPRIARLRSLETPRVERHQPGGVAMASKTGESMELLGVRPYRPGDPIRDLHARSSARAGVPIVREYQQEYFSRFGVLIDTDRSADPAALEAALSLAAGIVAHLSRGEALVDLLVVGDALHPLTLGRSLGFLDQALDLLALVTPGAPLDPATLLPRLGPHLGRLSCVVFVSLGWDAPRSALVAQLSRQVACRAILVSQETVPEGNPPTTLTPAQIAASAAPGAGAGLWL